MCRLRLAILFAPLLIIRPPPFLYHRCLTLDVGAEKNESWSIQMTNVGNYNSFFWLAGQNDGKVLANKSLGSEGLRQITYSKYKTKSYEIITCCLPP